jgi:hypothetical protein
MLRRFNSIPLAVGLILFAIEGISPAQVIGPPVRFGATDIVVPAPSAQTLHLSMDVFVEVPTGPIDASVLGMLFDISPNGAPLTLTGMDESSAGFTPIFPPAQSFMTFAAPAASGHDAAAVKIYTVAGENVTLPTGTYGLFKLNFDVAPNTTGTFDLVFDTTPEFTGLAGSLPNDDIIIYPNVAGAPTALGSVTIIPEPSALVLAIVAVSAAAVVRVRRRGRR